MVILILVEVVAADIPAKLPHTIRQDQAPATSLRHRHRGFRRLIIRRQPAISSRAPSRISMPHLLRQGLIIMSNHTHHLANIRAAVITSILQWLRHTSSRTLHHLLDRRTNSRTLRLRFSRPWDSSTASRPTRTAHSRARDMGGNSNISSTTMVDSTSSTLLHLRGTITMPRMAPGLVAAPPILHSSRIIAVPHLYHMEATRTRTKEGTVIPTHRTE